MNTKNIINYAYLIFLYAGHLGAMESQIVNNNSTLSRYRAYSEVNDNLGYLSYRDNNVFNYNLATYQEFRRALAELQKQVFASTSRQQLSNIVTLDKAIKRVVEKDDSISNWCKNKHISLISLFPEYENPDEEVDLPEVIALFYMMQKGNAIIIASALPNLARFVQILDIASTKIMDGIKLRVILNYEMGPLKLASYQAYTERFISTFHEQSFVESGPAFHTCCANEFHYMAELTVRTLLGTANTAICNQFFNLRDSQGKTPLIAATLFGMRRAVKHMIQASQKNIDIRINDRDDQGYSALDYAFLSGYTDLVTLLLSAGADFSFLSIIKNYNDPSLVSFIFKRAIICSERHFLASHNYLYLNEDNGLPIMVSDEHDSKWRFVVMHPKNPDALNLINTNSSLVNIESLNEFKRLQKLTSTKTFAQNRLDSLNDPVFLKNLIFLLARLGKFEAVQTLLELHENLDLLHDEKGLNLLHVCSNSYAITKNYLNSFVPESFEEIIAGRGRLVEFLIQHYPVLKGETTATSVGEENFAGIVERMYKKQQLSQNKLDPINLFNNLLYTKLRQNS